MGKWNEQNYEKCIITVMMLLLLKKQKRRRVSHRGHLDWDLSDYTLGNRPKAIPILN